MGSIFRRILSTLLHATNLIHSPPLWSKERFFLGELSAHIILSVWCSRLSEKCVSFAYTHTYTCGRALQTFARARHVTTSSRSPTNCDILQLFTLHGCPVQFVKRTDSWKKKKIVLTATHLVLLLSPREEDAKARRNVRESDSHTRCRRCASSIHSWCRRCWLLRFTRSICIHVYNVHVYVEIRICLYKSSKWTAYRV